MKPLLLLVEDDPLEARRLESALLQMGYDATLARDGDAALALMERMAFDVVLLDLVLPELDGMGLLGAMKARGIATPVVAAVTAAGLDLAASAIRAGARDFVVKPAGALRLRVALANAIALGAIGGPQPTAVAREAQPPRDAQTPRERVVTLRDARAPHENVVTLHAVGQAPSPAPQPAPFLDQTGHVRPLEDIEEKAIRFACALYGGRLTEVARRLGIGRSTLYRKLSRLGLTAQEGAFAHLGAVPPHHLEPIAAHIVAAE
ncbi:response regulator [Xanthobacter agilis]|uniref:DNA-binding NtrC family response regulator n=1 Tax=Xanthobacter agilis TaxID=47492 RepID=A0ABU0L8M4_XANAG|nr:response regulator [Xanthobacter agilis]MDQ0503489.1 DNA-binding NtrC family response regulator [Xanthobacter agilis]